MNEMRKLRLLETALFALSVTGILYLGADHPLPRGFYRLALAVITAAAMQHAYLIWLHANLQRRKTFLLTVLLSIITALGVTGLLIFQSGKPNREMAVWTLLIGVAAAVYGSLL